jgi:hypothetical protein
MTYVTGGVFQVPLVGPLLARVALATIGEPLRSTYPREEVRALLLRHQFKVAWDGYPGEWATNESNPLPLRLVEERITVADSVRPKR